MAEYLLHLPKEQTVTVSTVAVRRLIDCGSGDAALLYLCLAKANGAISSEALCRELRWEPSRLHAAEQVLATAGLIAPPQAPTAPAPLSFQERPSYSREDIAHKLEQDGTFSALLKEIERKLGPLSTPSTEKLLGLYEHLGLGADVIFLLVSHCIERYAEQYGEGRMPTMRQIEQEGYAWARRGLFSTASANEYLRQERDKKSRFGSYMDVLQLGGRKPSPGEEKYLSAWTDMGFPPETVAIAYDKTMLRCHEFKWSYCNGILKKWHEKGLHAPQEVQTERSNEKKALKDSDKNSWMDQYIKR